MRAAKRSSSDLDPVRKVFSYRSANAAELFSKIEWADADLMDFPAMEDLLAGVTEIYHCGAVVSFYPNDNRSMMTVNIEGTANLVNLAIEHKIRKFLYVSSVATLGRAENDGLTDEETYWKSSSRNSVYSVSKYGAEREVWRGMEEGLPAVIVNPSVILGPGFWDDNSGLFPLVWKGLKYYPKGGNGYVDVDDVVKAMTFLMESDITGERFIVNSGNITYLQLFTWIAKYLQKPAPTVFVNPFISNLVWRVEAFRSLLTKSKPELTRDMANTTSQTFAYSNEKIRKRTGMEFVPVEESIRRTCEIFLREVDAGC